MTQIKSLTVEVRNRFQGLDLIERVPEELWMEVWDIVQEAVIKIIPKKKKCKKAKWLSEDALQIAEKRREAKGKGEKERYTHLNAEYQRIARRDKKAFLTNQCKSEVKWSLSVVSNSLRPLWTVAYQAPSMGFSRQEYWSGVPLIINSLLPNQI